MVIKAFLPCVTCERDPVTRLMNITSIIGGGGGITCQNFPCAVRGQLFISLTDHAGPLNLSFRIVNLTNDQEIMYGTLPDAPPIPDRVSDFDFCVMFEVLFPQPGEYEFQVSGHGDLARRTVPVRERQAE